MDSTTADRSGSLRNGASIWLTILSACCEFMGRPIDPAVFLDAARFDILRMDPDPLFAVSDDWRLAASERRRRTN